ncbi:MAG TPA: rhodanese-like domain-containing protein [Candidatus Polarisedimenticolaceae bacterium]|nr:rhodanese-like domain-containing protein [Candidatus Polarisedimenticolaceae bacterium]
MPQIMISRDELQQRVHDGAHLIEVLPAKEFARAHLPGAINIPLAKFSEKTVANMDKKNATIVHCYDYQ